MKFRLRYLVVVFTIATRLADSAGAQQQPKTDPTSAQTPIKAPAEAIVVTGTIEPVPLSESDRPVVLIPAHDPALYASILNFLRSDPSVDVRQRQPGGIQADLSIDGSSFEQVLVLVNGLRVNDAQSGHHNADLPLPIESVARIEVLHGAGSTFHGADALGGAVNFITGPPEASELRIRAGVGNFGLNQQHLVASHISRNWSETIAADRDFSTGFAPDRDYRSTTLSSQTRFKTEAGTSDLLFAVSDRPFGADKFYGNFDSWERTKGWLVLVQQQVGTRTTIDFGYRRHSDEFILLRDNPSVYENNHISQSWQADLRRRESLGDNSSVSWGLEADDDQIRSNNLGIHGRNRGAGYLSLDFRALRRFSLSIGAREELFSGGRAEFVPSLAGGWWIAKSVRLKVSASRGFRLPTYTDLYYRDPANVGNPLLKPESSWSFFAGPELNPGGRISGTVTGIYRRDRNGIDYVKHTDAEPWQATNVDNVNLSGVEAAVHFRPRATQHFAVAYTGLHASQNNPGVISRYLFNYAVSNATISWDGALPGGLIARTRVRVTERYGQDPYGLWDASIARGRGRVRPYLQMSNITGTIYQQIPGVIQPGRSFIVGLEYVIAAKLKVNRMNP